MSYARSLPQPYPAFNFRRWAWLALAAALLVAAIGAAADRLRSPPTPATVASRAAYGPASFAEALEATERRVVAGRKATARAPDDWLPAEQLASALIARSRLTGSYPDLAEADRLLDRGLSIAPDPAGPVLTQAALALYTHRLDKADAGLARFARWKVPNRADKAYAMAMAGDIALQRGRLDEAAGQYAMSEAMAPSLGTELRQASLAAARGRREDAIGTLEKVLGRPHRQRSDFAQLALQRANLAYAQGQWEVAGRWIAAANRTYRGDWLGEAYAAQQQALAGHGERAIAAYEAIAKRTGRPEVMDALAHLLRLEGQANASHQWAERAARGWEARQALFPEAAAAHYAEHELALGRVDRALALAEADVARRPYGPSIALLARALILSGRPREALSWLDRSERQGWVSAGQLMLRADAAAALGDRAGSDAARARAEALNPRAADPLTRLIWFGHD